MSKKVVATVMNDFDTAIVSEISAKERVWEEFARETYCALNLIALKKRGMSRKDYRTCYSTRRANALMIRSNTLKSS
jgi:hypothetical protein